MGSSFDEVFEAEFPSLYRYLRRRVGASAADELAAATFATALRNWDRFDEVRAVRPWLYGIAANEMRHHWRTERRMLRAYARTGVDPIYNDDQSVLDRADAAALQRPLAAALAELRQRDREILLLHACADMSDGEIAAALEIPVGTVKSSLHRTRERIGNRLRAIGQEPSDNSPHVLPTTNE